MSNNVVPIYAAPSPLKVLEDKLRKTLDECLSEHMYNYAEVIGVLRLISADVERSAQNNALN
jgi:hypothetical protein